jgi:hypothetical protein
VWAGIGERVEGMGWGWGANEEILFKIFSLETNFYWKRILHKNGKGHSVGGLVLGKANYKLGIRYHYYGE